MNYFLAKTEPSTYSIDDLEYDKKTIWDGVHNYEAINNIKLMSVGDVVYIYHSMKDKKIVGIAVVSSPPFENKQDSRFSWAVELTYVRKVDGPSLAEAKSSASELLGFKLLTHSRLSVMLVSETAAKWIEYRI